jgi:radical SAM superfamily enzyme YgiQ (UPF0313 family)
MRVCLVSPPTATEFEDRAVAESEAVRLFAEHAPLGILSLAAVLEERGIAVHVVDLNRVYYRYLRSAGDDFCTFATAHLEPLECDVYGFGTLCNSYPLTIRIAQRLKTSRAASRVIFGGPQASVVDVDSMTAFPFIDFIVRGEAEESLPALLRALEQAEPLDAIPGVTFRNRETVVRNAPASVILDLDSLPMPAFHLCPEIRGCQYLPLELGRGCPFACSFCSTNDFFRRRFRVKSPAKVIQQMSEIRATYGVEWFDLIHDMFTVDRKKVAAFCNALLESEEHFYWNCSARTDCIDDALIALLARAGCRNIFFGIETGSSRMQRIIAKDLDLAESSARIRCASKQKIMTTISLITGFAEETPADLKETVAFIMDSVRFPYVKPQLHLLAPLAETPIHSSFRDRLRLDEVFSDISCQGWRQGPADRSMIEAHPTIFPNFYAVPTEFLERRYLKELGDFILHGIAAFKWLLVALHQASGDLLEVFDAWKAHHAADVPRPSCSVPFYARPEFARGFLEFARGLRHRRPDWWNPAVATLVESTAALYLAEWMEPTQPELLNGQVSWTPSSVPRLAPGVHLARLPASYKVVLRSLKQKGGLDRIRKKPVTVATRASQANRAELLELTSLSARLLQLCDGVRTVAQIAERFLQVSRGADSVDGVSPETICVMGLDSLREQGLVVA